LSDDDAPKIKVFASDDNLKALGELLSNDSSRSIIYNLMTKEMYTNEIATTLDMRVSLVIHHLKKLEDLGLLEITEKKIKRKGQEHRFFQIKSNIFVVLDNTKEEIKEKGILKKIFNTAVKLSVIALVSIGAFLTPNIFYQSELRVIEQGKMPDFSEVNSSTILLLLVIAILLILYFRKKKV